MLAGASFYGPCSTWRAGHLDQVILLVWPYCNSKLLYYDISGACGSLTESCSLSEQVHQRGDNSAKPPRECAECGLSACSLVTVTAYCEFLFF